MLRDPELFPFVEARGGASPEAARSPIGRPQYRRPRPASRRRRASAAALVGELRTLIERQHREVLAELARLGRVHRDREEFMPVLRALAALRHDLGLSELRQAPRSSRRRPLGVV